MLILNADVKAVRDDIGTEEHIETEISVMRSTLSTLQSQIEFSNIEKVGGA